MVKKKIFFFIPFLILCAFLNSCGKNEPRIRVGHSGGYISAIVYAVQDSLAGQADIRQFHSSTDIAYSLLSGALDAGFVEADKLAAFAETDGFDKLTVAGKITYPYGATLILRKGLDVRLQELGGLKIATSSPNCVLLKEFSEDALRLNADISGVNFEYLAFDAMIPALEAAKADAAIIKGYYSVVALQKGHSVLYQNWEVKPGDECCPAVIDQAALVLLVRRDKSDAVKPFIDALVSAQNRTPDELRHAVANNTVIPYEILQNQPVAEFSLADDELVEIFVKAVNEDHDGEEDENRDE
jgi:ABC-type nitrate/sulfonate/bicarbonate transport system substrate-binding protein